MLARLHAQISDQLRQLRRTMGTDLSTPSGRFWAHVNFQLFDHAFIRVLWTNFDVVAPGVYRSNQPSPRRLRRWARTLGLRSVLNLRGVHGSVPLLVEKEAAAAVGLTVINRMLTAKSAPTREMLESTLDALRAMQKPFLIHCKSGADRTGFVAVLYLAVIEDRPLAQARQHLAARYLHFNKGYSGVLDHFFDLYAARAAQSPITLETWIRTEYDREALLASWVAQGGKVQHVR